MKSKLGWSVVLQCLIALSIGCSEGVDTDDEGPVGPENSGSGSIPDINGGREGITILCGDEWSETMIISPYARDYSFVVGAQHEVNSDMFEEFVRDNYITFEFFTKDSVVDGYPFVYDMVMHVSENDEDSERYAVFEHIIINGLRIVQMPAINVFEIPEGLKAPARGASIDDYRVHTTFHLHEHYVELFEEVYYTDDAGSILTSPVYDSEYDVWSPLQIAPNPNDKPRTIVVNYGIKDIYGHVDKVTQFEVEQSGEEYIITSTSSPATSSEGGDLTISIYSNVELQVKEELSWVEYVGHNNEAYSFTITPNGTGEVRNGEILFVNNEKGFAQSITLVQYSSGTRTIHLEADEELSEKLSVDEMLSTESIIITGIMDDSDFETMNTYMTVLEYADLSGLESNTSSHGYGDFVTISDNAFYNMGILKGVILPENLKIVPYGAFKGCSSLESINIPNGVEIIGSSAFEGCTLLKRIDIPVTVKEFGFATFWGCSSLESIVIPEGVTVLPRSLCFECSSLKKVVLPSSLTKMENYMVGGRNGSQFGYCTSLEEINIPASIASIPIGCFSGCSSLKTIDLSSIEEIYDEAFYSCTSLENVKLSGNIKELGSKVFYNCVSLKSIDLPVGLKTMGYNLFEGCTSLTSVKLPATLTTVIGAAFLNCSSLVSVELPQSITTIDDMAFSGCALNEIELPKNLQSIGKGAFTGNPFKSVVIPDRVTSIGSFAFSECDIESIRIPENVTELGQYAFSDCYSLEKAIIKANITTLANNLFDDCTAMKYVQLPENLTTVEDKAFSGCQAVIMIYSEAKVPPTGEGLRPLVWEFIDVRVPLVLVDDYKEAPWWKLSSSIMIFQFGEADHFEL